MAEKEFPLPPELTTQLETLKGMLLNINEQKADAEDLALMNKNEAEINTEGKKPKQSVIKSQLALYRKEIKRTRQDMEKIKKAHSLVIEMQKEFFAKVEAARKDPTDDRFKDLLPEILKETAETLPLWIAENSDDTPPPLTGAIQPEENYISKTRDHVAAFVPVKKNASEWILAEVNNYNAETEEYKVQDIDDNQNTEYTVARNKIIPLPAMRANPEENPNALFRKGALVLAIYENTTCFYKGLVHEAPAKPVDPYQVVFEDADCPSGYSQPVSVPQRYVVAYRTFDD